ncbi:MAG: hypothetical protein AAFM92_07400 [Pseudomonadota bacterium]
MTKHFLGSAAVLALMASGAGADTNEAYLDQMGTGNSALITQSGELNDAGADSAGLAIDQNGTNNTLEFTQSGDLNSIADGPNGTGFNQVGANNSATITQTSKGNNVNQISQSAGATAGGATNTLTITQGASDDDPFPVSNNRAIQGNLVTNVDQTHGGGAANAITIDQERRGRFETNARDDYLVIGNDGYTGGAYQVDRYLNGGVIQNGSGNTATLTQRGYKNEIRLVEQLGDANTATVSQLSGLNNIVERVFQDSRGGASGNTATMVQDGRGNGNGAFSAGGPAANVSLVTNDAIDQIGSGNIVDAMITGNSNETGFYQEGNGNSVGTITVTGDFNEVAVSQVGDANFANISDIAGSSNQLGVSQTGTNTADVTLSATSDFNLLSISQDNTGFAADRNLADFDVTGSFNEATLTQSGGGDNSFDLEIIGDNNNAGSLFGTAASLGLTAGVFDQIGSSNSADIDVFSSSNAFATLQNGASNTIMASVSGGDGNSFGIVQMGASNMAALTQIGGGNTAGISQ